MRGIENLMILLPSDTFQIQSPLTLEEAVSRLLGEVTPRKLSWKFWQNTAFFQGEVSREGFRIKRISHSRNTRPIIRGAFKQAASGNVNVEVRIGVRPFDIIVMCIIFVIWAKVMLADPAVPFFVPAAFLILIWIIFLAGFWSEAKKAKKELFNIFQGQTRSA